MKKYIIYGITSVFSILQGQVNTEVMRSEDYSDGFTNQFNMEMGYEKANTEVLELAAEYRLDYVKQENFHSFILINLENGYEKESSEKNIIVNKGFGHLRITKNISSDLYIELFSQFVIR